MKAKRSNLGGVIALLLIGAAGVYGVGVYVKKTPEAEHVAPAIHRTSEDGNVKPADRASTDNQSSVKILTPKSKGADLSMDEATESVPDGTDAKVFAINRFLENTHITPSNARALSIDIKGDVAYVSFNEAMQKSYGSSDERTILQGLCKTLAQFPEVKKVQFEIDGKPMDSIGNVDLSQPLDVRNTEELSPADEKSTPPGA